MEILQLILTKKFFHFFAAFPNLFFEIICTQQRPKKPTMTKTKMPKMKRLSPELAEFIGKKVATHAQAFKIVFAYVKERKLQDPNDKKFFLPDKKMSKIFGTERIHILGGIRRGITANVC